MAGKLILGVTLIVIAFCAGRYAEPWFRTAGPLAVFEPVSLKPGHVTVNFLAGYNAHYRIGIDFAAPLELPFKKPNCVVASYYPPDDCSGIPSQLKVSWVLLSHGQVLGRGTAQPTIWRLSGGPFLTFAIPHLESARRYKLDVDFLNDGSQYASAQPRLSVGVFQAEFGKSFGLGIKAQAIEVLTRAAYGIAAVLGLALIVSAFVRKNSVTKSNV